MGAVRRMTKPGWELEFFNLYLCYSILWGIGGYVHIIMSNYPDRIGFRSMAVWGRGDQCTHSLSLNMPKVFLPLWRLRM